jgi:SNW domain-containing protein 1
MGKKGSETSNALAIQVDAEGKVKYDAIATQVGHREVTAYGATLY